MTQLPRKELDHSEATTRALATNLSAYYRLHQGRGHRCTVELYLRGGRYHYLFAYPDDYADTYIGHGDDGRFVRRAQKRAFELVFVYDPLDATLDLFAQGQRRMKMDLFLIFCEVVLKERDGVGRSAEATYELDGLLARGFPFPTDPADGIEEVRVRRLRLSVGGGPRKITLEADPKGDAEAVYDMMDEYLSEKCRGRGAARVTQATLQFCFAQRAGVRPKSALFDITWPDSCTLKSLPEEQRLLGEKYLKRWGIDRA